MDQNMPVAPVQNNAPAPSPDHKPGLTTGVWSIVCAVISLFFFPPLFGIIGIYLGYKSKKQGNATLGTVGIALSVVLMILGMFFGALLTVWLKTHK